MFTKYVLRPDVSKLKELTLEQLNKNPLPPLSKRQKLVALICVCFLSSMLLPSLFPKVPLLGWLSANAFGTAMFFLVLLFAIQIDGKPLMSIQESMNIFAWGTYFLVVSAILLGGVLTNESTGVVAFLNTILSPVFSGMGPVVFGIVLLVITCVLTNVCNSLVIGMILQPVIATYCIQAGIPSAPLVSIMGIFALSCAIATPAASPFAAMLFGNKDWLKSGDIYKYNISYVLLELVIVLVLGLPLANGLIH